MAQQPDHCPVTWNLGFKGMAGSLAGKRGVGATHCGARSSAATEAFSSAPSAPWGSHCHPPTSFWLEALQGDIGEGPETPTLPKPSVKACICAVKRILRKKGDSTNSCVHCPEALCPVTPQHIQVTHTHGMRVAAGTHSRRQHGCGWIQPRPFCAREDPH